MAFARRPTRGDCVGIVGAGQLARMTYQAGIALGLTVRLLAETPEDAAALVAADVETGSAQSLDVLRRFAASCDVLTFEHELIDPAHLRDLESGGHILRPSAAVATTVFDKRRQREVMVKEGLPVPAYTDAVEGADDIVAFGDRQGWPLVVKLANGGYDGRGVFVVRDAAEAEQLSVELAGRALLVEAWVPIEQELAVMVARRPSGECVVYPVVETVQRDGICHEVFAPAPLSAALEAQANAMGRQVAEAMDLVGVLAVELFVTADGLVVNELAARPHNSGHHTIEGCVTSQFENHLRAVLDLPLGEPGLVGTAVAMANVLGAAGGAEPQAALGAALEVPGAHVHLYGKQARPGRKLGHVTVVGDDLDDARERARRAAGLLMGAREREPV